MVGFGQGFLKFVGGVPDNVFVLRSSKDNAVHAFEHSTIRAHLTFDWFKLNVICEDQPWICVQFPPLDS